MLQVVLASVPDMQSGYSRELFLQWCSNAKNCIILTNRTQPGTLSRILIDNPLLRSITLDVGLYVMCETWNLSSHIGVHTHAGSTLHNPVTLTFDLVISGSMHAEVLP